MTSIEPPINRTSLFIDGKWQRPLAGGSEDIINPANGVLVGKCALADAGDVDLAVDAARKSFDSGVWSNASSSDRAAVLRRATDIIESRTDELIDLITMELGCPRSYAQNANVPTPLRLLRYYADLAETYDWQTVLSDGSLRSVIVRQPVGVVGSVTPWNGPLTNPTIKIAPALAAGCSIVLKSAPVTPLAGYVVVEAFLEAGLPPGVLNYVPGDRDAGRHLVSNPKIDKVAFTGSTAAGREILGACANRIGRVTLELGGKSAAIMLEDANVNNYVEGVLPLGLMFVNGQACIAQSRLLVPRSRYREVADALTSAVSAVKIGDPFDPETQLGPLVSAAQRNRVEGYIASGLNEGARITVGGGRPKGFDAGWYVEPTVMIDVTNGMKVAQDEIFGPVIVLIAYDDEDEAVSIANDSVYGLAGSVWTTDDAHGLEIARRLRTGMVSINGHPQSWGSPFGGFKQSGLGREFGVYGLEAYTELQTIAVGP